MALLMRLLLVFVAWILLRRALRWGMARMSTPKAPPRRDPAPPETPPDLQDAEIEDAEYEELP